MGYGYASLNNTKMSIKHTTGSRSFGKAGLAIDATPADVETTAAIDYCIDGVMYNLGITAAIDVSGLAVIDSNGAAAEMTAQAKDTDRAYLLVVNAAGTIKVVQGTAVATGATCPCPTCPEGYAPFGAVKVANGTEDDFTFGTTSLATVGITDTYFDLSMAPATL